MGLNDFKASNGWLEAFQGRHSISMRNLCGESADMNLNTVEDWMRNVMTTIGEYDLKDIFNCDETGLFWRGSPTKTLAEKADKCIGGKLAKERVTILLTVSAMGEKLKPFVIAKSLMPRCFNRQLPTSVFWRANKKAWMTGELFREYLGKLNESMISQNRKILLLLDNAPCHPQVDLSHVKLLFLPPNTTAGTQPCDAGIIKNFKYFYRKKLIEYLIARIDRMGSFGDWIKELNQSQMVLWIAEAWNSVKESTIINCFKHCGIKLNPADIPENEEFGFTQEELEDLLELLHIEDPAFVEDIATSETRDDWEDEILGNPNVNVDVIQDEELGEDDEEEIIIAPNMTEGFNIWQMYRQWSFYNDTSSIEKHILEIDKFMTKEKLKLKRNSKITDYF
jgi:hypothetical protein